MCFRFNKLPGTDLILKNSPFFAKKEQPNLLFRMGSCTFVSKLPKQVK